MFGVDGFEYWPHVISGALGMVTGLGGAYVAVIRDLSYMKGVMEQLLEGNSARHEAHAQAIDEVKGRLALLEGAQPAQALPN